MPWIRNAVILCLAGFAAGCATQQNIVAAPATSPILPHIDAVNLHEQDTENGLVIYQEIVFHAPDGNVTAWQNALMDTSAPAPRINLGRGGAINVSKDQQIKGALANAVWHCGPAHNKYWFVKRMTLVDATGRQSNAVDVKINCH